MRMAGWSPPGSGKLRSRRLKENCPFLAESVCAKYLHQRQEAKYQVLLSQRRPSIAGT